MTSSNQYLYLWAQWGVLNFQQYQQLTQEFSSLQEAWDKITPEHFRRWGMGEEKIGRIFDIRSKLDFQHLVQTLEEIDGHILSLDSPDYPERLKQITNPPPFLFVRSQLPSLHKALAVVGTRAATSYGKQVAEKLTTGLVHQGFVIVSGLAMGIDTFAHQTTIENQGITVAVLGSGVDQIYPAANQRLAEAILQSGGAIVSTYPLGTPAMPHHFPERNEIVAGLSRGVLVIEGSLKSGALITARLALEQGREVFAVPHDITRKGLEGTHHLIRRGEAKLVSAVEDILEEFQLSLHDQPSLFQPSSEHKPLLSALEKEPKTADELSQILSLPIPDLTGQLVELSLQGAVVQVGERWALS